MMSIRPNLARCPATTAAALAACLAIGACNSPPNAPPPTASEAFARSSDADLRTRLITDFPLGSSREAVEATAARIGLRIAHYQRYSPSLDRSDTPTLAETTSRFDVLLIADAMPAYKDQDPLPARQRLVTFRFSSSDELLRIEVRPPKDPNAPPTVVIE
ncbi:MAG: hypothetical protein KF745_07760 [Phycisphaeraceae bacterium]|nr:hypothetical protein [Phycisphaeraceae bacterium]